MSYKSILASLLFGFSLISYAQSTVIKGQVIDGKTQQAIDFASVALYALPDSVLAGGVMADEQGKFEITQTKEGNYFIKVIFMGYQTYTSSAIAINLKQTVVQLEPILLQANTLILKDVEVSGQKEMYTQNVDKKVFNVDRSLVSIGGSATDVLKQIPTISTDADGNVQMRGSGSIQVLINGKPSSLTGNNKQAILDQIPASTIESVELITNPSAKYDPDGVSGILNIVLKKNNKGGIGGQAVVGIGNRNKANASLGLYYKKDKWSISGNYGYRYNQNWQYNRNYRKNFFKDSIWSIDQVSDYQVYLNSHAFNLNVDYDINAKNLIGFGTSLGYNTSDQNEEMRYAFRNRFDALSSSRNRDFGINLQLYNADVMGFYKHLYDKNGKELSISSSYSFGKSLTQTGFTQQDFSVLGQPLQSIPSRSNISPLTYNNIGVVQLDFTNPVNEKIKFESGLKGTFRHLDNDLRADTFQNNNAQFVRNDNIANRFQYEESVLAAYALIQWKIGKYNIQPGMRFEQTEINIAQVSTQESFRQSYGNLFPSVHAMRSLNNGQEISFSYGRRINRPNIESLNPFPSYFDPLNLMQGNPFIRPEYLDVLEAGYQKNFEKHSIGATAYYRYTSGTIQRFRNIESNGVAITQFTNLNNAFSSGLELITTHQFNSWFNAMTNINAFWYSIQMPDRAGSGKTNNDAFSGNGRITLNFKFPRSTEFQVTGNYMLPYIMLQGSFQGFNGIDLAVKKDLLKKKLFVTLAVNDVFDTKNIDVRLSDFNFDGTVFRKRESRFFTINLTYRFGKELGVKSRMKKIEINQSGGEGAG